jgi:hypothetical protein
MHQNPLRVFLECGVAKYVQNTPPFLIVVGIIDKFVANCLFLLSKL